jgi:predicted transcriptional regulator
MQNLIPITLHMYATMTHPLSENTMVGNKIFNIFTLKLNFIKNSILIFPLFILCFNNRKKAKSFSLIHSAVVNLTTAHWKCKWSLLIAVL